MKKTTAPREEVPILDVTPMRGFDYSVLDNETAEFLKEQTQEISIRAKRAAEDLLEIGRRLWEVKTRLPSGQFLEWIEVEFSWSHDTAHRFMRVYERFKGEEISQVAKLAPSILYILAAPSTPEEAADEALARVAAGEKVGLAEAKALKEKYRPKDKKRPEPLEVSAQLVTGAPLALQEEKAKPEILGILPKGREASSEVLKPRPCKWWRIKTEKSFHWLYNGKQEEAEFLDAVPDEINFWLSFPKGQENWEMPPRKKIYFGLSLFTLYEEIDLKDLRTAIENTLSISTAEGETVIVSHLLDPVLIALLDDLEVKGFIAEPERERCEDLFHVCQQLGYQMENLAPAAA
jgi:hypothetical protein